MADRFLRNGLKMEIQITDNSVCSAKAIELKIGMDIICDNPCLPTGRRLISVIRVQFYEIQTASI